MINENKAKWSRFAIVTLVVLALVGGIRTVLHVGAVVLYGLQDEMAQQIKSIESCERFFCDGDQWEGEHLGKERDLYWDTPTLPPTELTKCEKWHMEGKKILDRFYGWQRVLWFAGALVSFATLLVAILVFRRNPIAGKVMYYTFIFQVAAAICECVVAFQIGILSKRVIVALWPRIGTDPFGWFFVNGQIVSPLVIYTFACLLYLWLVLRVRSKNTWSTVQPESMVEADHLEEMTD